MPHTVLPTPSAINITIVPLEPDSPSHSWIPTPDVWNAAPTMLLPPAKPAPPVSIPDGVYLIPTDMLPPPMLGVVPRDLSSILPPAMVGPIQIVDVAATVPVVELFEAPSIPTPTPAALPIADFPLRRCAAIAACIALRPTEAATILETHKLGVATWKALEVHWKVTIKTALADADPALLRAYDAAFVAAIEQQRGPITPGDHARIVGARLRGRSAETMAALGLPASAALPMERVLLQRAIAAWRDDRFTAPQSNEFAHHPSA